MRKNQVGNVKYWYHHRHE